VLQALRGAGTDIDSDCEEGYCGTCELAVLDGVPDHRESVLSTTERSSHRAFMPCV
jgi:ferredoxin